MLAAGIGQTQQQPNFLPPNERKITFIFENTALKFMDIHGFQNYDWSLAEHVFKKILEHVDEETKTSLSTLTVCLLRRIQGSYSCQLLGRGVNLTVLIKDQWAENLAGPYLDALN